VPYVKTEVQILGADSNS